MRSVAARWFLRVIGLVVGSLVLPCVVLVHEAGAFGPETTHPALNRESLNFLRPAIQDDVTDEHVPLDSGISGARDERHFDDCEFDGAAEYIRDRYNEAMVDFALGGVWGATDAFGKALHPVQDLYAHSNWVELGYPLTPDNPATRRIEVRRSDLIPLNNATRWSAPRSLNGNAIRDDILLGGDDWNIPDEFSINSGGDTFVPTLIHKGRTVGRLLTTGEGKFDDECDVLGIPSLDTKFEGFEHNDLAKDDRDGPQGRRAWDKARALAALQTGDEWCRLVRNAGLIGADGLLLTTWVASQRSPHPLETRCAPLPRPANAVGYRIDILSIQVLDSGDDDKFDPGEIQFSTALYDSALDFHRSTHRTTPKPLNLDDGQFVPANSLPAPSILCVPLDTPAVTFAINGWDNDHDSGDRFAADFDDKNDDDELLRGFQLTIAGTPSTHVRTATSADLGIRYKVSRDERECPPR
jgi:hypothetical protein